MGIRFCMLASGSTGNAALVAGDDCRLLLDAGLSARKLEQLMEARDWHPSGLDGILVTHEHSDHIKGLSVIARKYELPVYANRKTWEAMENQTTDIADNKRHLIETGGSFQFGGMRVDSFAVSHDAADPVGYTFSDGECKLSFATDLGYMGDKVRESIKDSDVLILESNHDIEMLRIGRYPWNVKRRILSDVGHLSNEAAGEALCDIMLSGKVRRVYLAHLSRDHNVMDLAKMTIHNIAEERGYSLRERRISLMETYYDRPTLWDAVGME